MPAPDFLAGQILPASDLQALVTGGSYSPELAATTTNPNLGIFGSATGEFDRDGDLVRVEFAVEFGTSGTSSGSGVYLLSVPEDWPIDAIANQVALGQVRLRNDSSTNRRLAQVWHHSSTHVRFEVDGSPTSGSVSNNSPWTWSTVDSMRGSFTYRTDG